MIKRLNISNFQSHKNSELEFDEGINIIIGQSDSGKSAILRALRWVVDNTPSGDSFRSTWGGNTKVELSLDEDKVVGRSKTKTTNQYDIKNAILTSFNQGVPEEIKSILNFSSLNLQSQFDSPFLLAMSGGEVARYLNKIVHLDKIDLSLSNIGKTLRKEQTDLKYTEKEYDTAKEKEKEFDWIDGAEGCLVKLEIFEGVIRNKKNRYASLHLLCTGLEEYDNEIKEVSQLTQYEGEVNKLMVDRLNLDMKKKRYSQMNSQVDNLECIQAEIEGLEDLLPVWQERFEKLMPKDSICPLCGGSVK